MTIIDRVGFVEMARAARLATAVLLGCILLLGLASASQTQPGAPRATDATKDPVAAAVSSAPDSAQPQPSGPLLDRADLEAWLDGYVPASLQRGDIAGVVVSVVKDGEILLGKGYGFADVASKRPMDADTTLIRPGSVSKLFTWTAVMQLVEQGKLDLDADINAYLDFKLEYPFGKPVTLRQLMAHRGGFEEGLKSVMAVEPKNLISTEQYLKANPRPMVFAPGTVPAYSNYGTSLAGYIVQRVSGEPFEAYVERHILAPLGMTRSTFVQPLPAALAGGMSQGYMTASEPPRPFELVTTGPAGALSATATDMAKFMLAYLQQGKLLDQQILRPETVRQMQQGAERPYPGFQAMAYGFFEGERNGRHWLGHGGDTVVFHSDLYLLPNERTGIFFSANSRGAQNAVYAMREALFKGFVDRYFPAPNQPGAGQSGSAPAAAGGFASTQPTQTAPALSSAAFDSTQIAGRYESSRRVESAFLNVFYLLGETVISANADGTISMSEGDRPKVYRETAPNIWTQVDGDQKLALASVGGRRAVINNEDPTSVLQAVPGHRSGGWNLPLFGGAVAVLLLTVILWPVAALVRRHYRAPLQLTGRDAQARTLPRIAALVGLGWLFGWYLMMEPLMSNHLEAYDVALDSQLRLLQVLGLVLIAAAAIAVWGAWRTVRGSSGMFAKLGSVLIALALLDLVWFGSLAKLLSFNSGY